MQRKKIAFQVPCFNEENNVEPMAETITNIMLNYPQYDYEIVFRDNASTDMTVENLRKIAKKDKRIKVIVNARNYGLDPMKNTFIGRIEGDIIIYIPCDFQEPPEMIPEFISWWEKGYEVVVAQKTGSEEGRVKYGFRQFFYKIIDSFSENKQVKNMSGIFLISRRVADIWWNQNRDTYFRFFIMDLGCDIKIIQYKQKKRRSGRSSFNFSRSLSFAINSLISTSTVPLRLATLLGLGAAFISFILGVIYLIIKLLFWGKFATGVAPILIGMFFICAVQLFFIGMVGEYVGNILRKVSPTTPPVVRELINFEISENDKYLFESVKDIDLKGDTNDK